MDELKRERSRRGAMFGLSGVIFETGRWRGQNEVEKEKKRYKDYVIGCDLLDVPVEAVG